MKLYCFAGACSFVPHTALILCNADHEIQLLSHEAAKQPEYLAKNPMGAVPLLEDGDFCLTQNVAILNYLNDKYPDAGLFGKGDSKQQAKARQWLSFANADLHKAYYPIFRPSAFVTDPSLEQDVNATARKRVTDMYKVADDALVDSDFLTGEMTVADLYLYVSLRWATLLGIDLSLYKNLTKFINTMQAVPAVQQSLKAEGLELLKAA